MNIEIIPFIVSKTVFYKNKVVFLTIDKETVVEAPISLVRQIINICDGSKNLKEVIATLSKKWDITSIEALMEDLIIQEVIVDARSLEEHYWKNVQNYQNFPRIVSPDEVKKLVSNAKQIHRQKTSNYFYEPSTNILSEVIRLRVSTRNFSGETISLQTLVDMLWSAYGEFQDLNQDFHRTIPSAGALYPLTFHLGLFLKTGDLESGIYEIVFSQDGKVGFNRTDNCIEKLVCAFINPEITTSGAQGVLVISGSFFLSNQKYGNRSLLYTPLEAGHSSQNFILEATRQSVATLEIGGFVDKLVSRFIGLPKQYHPMTSIFFGISGEPCDKKQETESLIEFNWMVPDEDKYDPGFVIASARVKGRIDWSNGRDSDPKIALKKAMSEAKEWAACGNVPNLVYDNLGNLGSVIDPADVISFHDKQYEAEGFPFAKFSREEKYGWTNGYELNTGKDFYVLADLVYFPYQSSTSHYCYANSSGCAARPELEKAIEISTLELIERDSFMCAYLCKLNLPRISFRSLPESIQDRIRKIEREGFNVWILDHSLDFAPVCFVFVQHQELSFTACSSCASFEIEYAISHALTEVEAFVYARLNASNIPKIKPKEVSDPVSHGVLYAQPAYFRKANFLVEGRDEISFQDFGNSVSSSWSSLMDVFKSKGYKQVVVPLSLPENKGGNDGLNIVRSIIPGLVPMTFGFGQSPLGMKRLYDVSRVFGKKMNYRLLNKFTHPFA